MEMNNSNNKLIQLLKRVENLQEHYDYLKNSKVKNALDEILVWFSDKDNFVYADMTSSTNRVIHFNKKDIDNNFYRAFAIFVNIDDYRIEIPAKKHIKVRDDIEMICEKLKITITSSYNWQTLYKTQEGSYILKITNTEEFKYYRDLGFFDQYFKAMYALGKDEKQKCRRCPKTA